MTDRVYVELADVLLGLEMELRNLGLWRKDQPHEEALASVTPFCADTLEFHEWLQFIFIERMKVIVEFRAPMPPMRSGIEPAAEMAYQGQLGKVAGLLASLRKVDEAINNARDALAGGQGFSRN
ncbi:YqcC family protein [Hahella sp. CR1]|uniref:YqcC family protein n=1 Tax=unclassified Hahella TaxID=2624107 RepID=UPI002442DE1E|nr:YqcC family protein [Hahella sp. CR1]MDG9671746.1 YqcC family protein [Hahella sp. CR1]